jgi:transcriptional regulator CtsR
MVSGDRINYPFDIGTPTADMLLVKLLFNSVISTKNAKFMSLDIRNFYLEMPMERYEYMRMRMADIPDEIIEQYMLKEIEKDGYVYVEIRRGMYGLLQAEVK